MTTINYTTLTDHELSQHLGAAILDQAPHVSVLEAERQRRLAEAVHQRIADAERQRRQVEADAIERDALLGKLIALRDDLRVRFVATLHKLDTTPPVDVGPLLELAYQLGRSAYAVAHDLAGATGDRRLELRWDVSGQIELHGGAPGAAFVAALRGRSPVVPTPWAADITRLRALTPPVDRVANGG